MADDTNVSGPAPSGLASALSGIAHHNSFMDALRGIKRFVTSKPGSASNDSKYQKDLTDAGMDPNDTGIGK